MTLPYMCPGRWMSVRDENGCDRRCVFWDNDEEKCALSKLSLTETSVITLLGEIKETIQSILAWCNRVSPPPP